MRLNPVARAVLSCLPATLTYHRGLALGETPNIDRIGQEGAVFTDYYAMQSCTSGRNVFFTGMYPLRTGMIPPQLPGNPLFVARHPGDRQISL